jgi:DNA-binding MarR family transcriptional regulator
MNRRTDILEQFKELDFTDDEAKIYLELLHAPSTHLQLSHATGVNRTKVYRIVESLEHRSIVARRTDDRGTFLTAADPAALEVSLSTKQQKLLKQQEILNELIPTLNGYVAKDDSAFIVRNYEGVAGLKQMCWHELKAKGETLALGNGTIEQQVEDDRWADNYRKRQIEAGYRLREVINYGYTKDDLPDLASELIIQSKRYRMRKISSDVVSFDSQTVIYNNTVAVYHWKHDQKVGVEIINAAYANMMKHVFEYYWSIGEE